MKRLNFIIETIVMLHDKFQFHKSIYQQIVTLYIKGHNLLPGPQSPIF